MCGKPDNLAINNQLIKIVARRIAADIISGASVHEPDGRGVVTVNEVSTVSIASIGPAYLLTNEVSSE